MQSERLGLSPQLTLSMICFCSDVNDDVLMLSRFFCPGHESGCGKNNSGSGVGTADVFQKEAVCMCNSISAFQPSLRHGTYFTLEKSHGAP